MPPFERPLASLTAILAAAALSWGPAVAQETATFTSQVEAVHLDVLVVRAGHIVEGLRAEDFEVRDNNVLQTVDLLAGASVPLHAVLVFDISGSVAGPRLDRLRLAANDFIDGLAGADRLAVVTFNHELRLVAGPGVDRQTARGALGGIQAFGATALYDAVFAGLALADPRVGRPVILVFSDGENTLSWLTREKVIEAARRSEAMVYGVGAGGLESSTRAFLEDVALPSGGRVWQTKDDAELRAAFGRLLVEIKGRYLLRFEPKGVAGAGWHGLSVKLKGQPGDVRTRRGYFRR